MSTTAPHRRATDIVREASACTPLRPWVHHGVPPQSPVLREWIQRTARQSCWVASASTRRWLEVPRAAPQDRAVARHVHVGSGDRRCYPASIERRTAAAAEESLPAPGARR